MIDLKQESDAWSSAAARSMRSVTNMKLSKLYERLQPEVSWACRNEDDPEVDLPLPAETGAARSGVLYIDTAEKLLRMSGDICAICVGKSEKKRCGELSGNVLRSELNMLEVFRQVELCFAEERRVTAAEKRLMHALQERKNLQQFIEEASNVIGFPIVIIDSSYRILALNSDVTVSTPNPKSQTQISGLLDKYIQTLRENPINEVNEHAREADYPIRLYDYNSGVAWIHHPLLVDGIAVAQISIPEVSRSFERTDYEILVFLGELISTKFQKPDGYRKNLGPFHSTVLYDLLDGVVWNTKMAEQRAALQGWNSADRYLLMTVFESNRGFSGSQAKMVSEIIRPLLPDSRWAFYEGLVVFLLPDGLSARELRDLLPLRTFLKNSGLRAAVSSEFSALTDIRTAYDQSLHAYELGRRLNADEIILTYDSYVIYHIGSILSERGGLRYFSHPAVLRIAQRDKAKRSNLLGTLDEYLQHIDDPGKAAENLHIHKNTLFYRIARMKEEFGLDLSDGEERMRIQMTLAFLRLGI